MLTAPATAAAGTATVRPFASATCAPAPHLVCITAASGGKVTLAHVGDEVEVILARGGLEYAGLHERTPTVLRLERGPTDHAGVVRATYRAVRPGVTYLVASASPRCTPGQACPDFVLLFSARVRVLR